MSGEPGGGRLLDRVPFTALGLLWPFGGSASRRRRTDDDDAGGRGFRLVTSNAFKHNRHPEAWAAAVLDLRPDVLCVEELTPALEGALRESCRLLPHGCTEARPDSGGTGVWSRWALRDAEVVQAGYAMVVAPVPALGCTVAALHTVAPAKRAAVPRWWEGFDAVDDLVARTPGPLVVAGDWNATMGHGPLRRLLAGGRLRDAHVDAGRRFARTWPARVPFALLDRVLVSEHMAVRSITEHRVPGTDHRAVAADLVVAGASCS